VPSFRVLTPAPAVAVFTPFGNTTAGQTFKHWAVQGVWLAFNV
jgi:hypothetical protein